MSRLFLGLDSSTQSLSAVIIDLDSGKVVAEEGINFAEDLPQYGTDHGVLTNDDPRVAHAPPLMWAEALDLLFARLRDADAPLGDVLAVSGSGQQHGSVYLNATIPAKLENLNPSRTLVENLAGAFSRATSPIWMDSSTTEECQEIMDAMGGATAVAEATGSVAFERFTGPQIRKFFKTDATGYADTAHIALVSSFMASIMGAGLAPIDHGDGAGMNMMDITAREWSDEALDATAPGLAAKLLGPVPSWTITGAVSSYFVKKYGLSATALNVVWSGDNPNSLIGLGLIEPGYVAISLGTSDTFFGTMQACRVDPRGEGHVFVSPTGDYMSLICFKNGSLARERVRDAYGLDWPAFVAAGFDRPVGNNGAVLLPYFEPEIVPKVLEPGVRRFDLDETDVPDNCRAVVEAQMLSMRLHSRWMQVAPTRIYATGGASKNPLILRIMTDVHQCPVYGLKVANSAALGASLRAAHAYLTHTSDTPPLWHDIVDPFVQLDASKVVRPDRNTAKVYDNLLEKYAACEREVAG